MFFKQFQEIPMYVKGLVTNYGEGGGSTKRVVGHVKFYPYEKWVGTRFSHAVGHKKFWGSFYEIV